MQSIGHMDQRRRGRVVLGAMSLAGAIGYLAAAQNMPRGDLATPGPGMFPIGVGALWIIASLVVVVEAIFSEQDAGSLDIPQGFERRRR